ncbi:MAG: phenylacetate--CoA ligase family protein [Rhodocyclaceae bacterium]|nr:phenylacetate--CoA ligase family protein [Rhodocyclaceae bacterium]
MSQLLYFDSFDWHSLKQAYPLGEDFMARYRGISRDHLFAIQDAQFKRCIARGWEIPFYQRLWGAKGIQAGDIRGLEDIAKLPTFSKTELMESVELVPPLGDYHGLDSYDDATRPPMILHTTSGTTGRPQPLVFGPRGREIQNLLLGRAYTFQGIGHGDTVHSVYGHGLINGGHYVREAVLHYTRAVFLSAGTGVETRSLQQVQIMRDFGVTAVVGFADYIKKLAEVAHQSGIVPGRDIPVKRISGHLGRESREALSASWGDCEVFDWYGVGDTGLIAAEGPDHDGLYVMEDAQYVEIGDVDTDLPVADGENGNLIVTCLYKDDIYPCIRFNTKDVSAVKTGGSAIDLGFKRIEGFLGRSDNMIKLRGINIYPQGLAPVLEQNNSYAGEFVCVAERGADGRDELTVRVEVKAGFAADAGLVSAFEELLKQRFGVQMKVTLDKPGTLAPLTGIETRQKPIRLIDNRFN